MKNNILTITALTLCMSAAPAWAFEGPDNENKLESPFWAIDDDNDNIQRSATSSMCQDDTTTIKVNNDSNNRASTEPDSSSKFFVHISNPEAARIYEDVASNYQFSINNWRREIARFSSPERNENTFKSARSVEQLCIIMRKALKKFGATQILMPANGANLRGLIVELTTEQEQSIKAVVRHCKRSKYVYKVFGSKEAFYEYMDTRTLSHLPESTLKYLDDSYVGLN